MKTKIIALCVLLAVFAACSENKTNSAQTELFNLTLKFNPENINSTLSQVYALKQDFINNPTNISTLNEKIKTDTLTQYDVYLAQKYLGINANDFAQIVKKFQIYAGGGGGDDELLHSVLVLNSTLSKTILSFENVNGWSAFYIWLNESTYKFFSLSYDLIQLKTNISLIAYRMSELLKQNKASQRFIDDMKELIGIGFSQTELLQTYIKLKKALAVIFREKIIQSYQQNWLLPSDKALINLYFLVNKEIPFLEEQIKAEKFDFVAYKKLLENNKF